MNRFSLFLSVCILLLASETTLAQTASDYYLPLRVGNYLQYQSSDRTTTHSIIQSDSISGHEYFLEKRSDVMIGSNQTYVYFLMWLREGSSGEIVVGAMGTTGSIDGGSWSTDLHSATIYDPPGTFFSNQSIVPGYSYSYSMEDKTWVDTTMSNTETVQVTAGTFTNCVKIRETKRKTSNDSLIFIEYTYYAPGMGIVKIARDGNSSDDLIGYNAATSVSVKNELTPPAGFSLYQNYPNPFNPSTTLRYGLPSRSRVRLIVYNILGQVVANLVNNEQAAGWNQVVWNANVASGLYFYRMEAVSVENSNKRFVDVKKMILLK